MNLHFTQEHETTMAGGGSENDEIMTVAEVAVYLQLAEKTIVRMAQRGDIPAAKVASQWRFMRSLVREWLVAQMQTLPAGRLDEVVQREDALLPLHEMIRPELMSLDIKPGPKDAVLRQIVAPLVQTGFATDPSRLLGNLLERERMMTTAIGHGVALPHPRKPIAGMFPEPAIALGLCPTGTDFEAIDDQMGHVFFLVCATREEIHLQLMAKIAWLSRREVLGKLRTARDAATANELIAQAVVNIDDKDQGTKAGRKK
jgi:PTS system nitrogen regulatory IIA component